MKKIKQIGKTLPKVKGSRVAKALGGSHVGRISKTGYKYKPISKQSKKQLDLYRFFISQLKNLVWFFQLPCPKGQGLSREPKPTEVEQ